MSGLAASMSLWGPIWAAGMGRACWQGGLAIALVWALCRLMPRLPGQYQCWLWRLAYLKLLVTLLWVHPLKLPVLAAPPASPAPAASLAAPGDESGRWPAPASPPGDPSASVPAQQSGPQVWLMLLWLSGSGGCGAQLFRSWRRSRRLRTAGVEVRDGSLLTEHAVLCERLRIRPQPPLLTSEALAYPVLVGVGAPAVVLPASFPGRFDAAQLRLMLAHELAHLKRRDLLWAWLPNLGRVLCYFHPLVWLAEREWRLAQEMACDEQVVVSLGASPTQYGALLLEIIGEAQRDCRAGLLALGVAGAYATMKRRLEAIRRLRFTAPRARRQTLAGRALAGGVLVFAAVAGIVPWRLTARPVPAERVAALANDEAPPGDPRHPSRGAAAGQKAAPDRSGSENPFPLGSKGSVAGMSRSGALERPGKAAQAPHLRSNSVSVPSTRWDTATPERPASVGGHPISADRSIISALRHRENERGAPPNRRASARTRFGGERPDAMSGPAAMVAALPAARGESVDPGSPASPAAPLKGRMAQKIARVDETQQDPTNRAFIKSEEPFGVLRMPKSIAVPAAFIGWHRSSLSRKYPQLQVEATGASAPRDLKKMLIALNEGQPIDLRAFKKALASPHPEDVGDRGTFKMMLAQIAQRYASVGRRPEGKPIFLQLKGAVLFDKQIDEKRSHVREAGTIAPKQPARGLDNSNRQGAAPDDVFSPDF